MRSSKSRSRSKSNRNRSVGNIVNRVFDSSGPEGKVRGTPQQIIDKYNQLARDAQLSNDRVAAENFQQHAEHYLRMLSEAQREQDARREQQERENRERQAERDRERAAKDAKDKDRDQNTGQGNDDAARNAPSDNRGDSDVIDTGSGSDSGLVDTPEEAKAEKPKPARKPRKKPAPKAETRSDGDQDAPNDARDEKQADTQSSGGPAEAAE